MSEPLVMKFHPSRVPKVLSRLEWMTWRYDPPPVRCGQLFVMQTVDGHPFAKSPVEMVAEMPARVAFEYDFEGHRSYQSLDQMLSRFQRYYPDTDLKPETPLKVIAWDPDSLVPHPEYDPGPPPEEKEWRQADG